MEVGCHDRCDVARAGRSIPVVQAGQGARSIRPGRRVADGGHRSHFRLRRDPAHSHTPQREVLTRLSRFWFDRTRSIVPNHISPRSPGGLPGGPRADSLLEPRSMVVHKTEPLPFEDVIRGYLSGSAWKEYRKSGKIGGPATLKGLRNRRPSRSPSSLPLPRGRSGSTT